MITFLRSVWPMLHIQRACVVALLWSAWPLAALPCQQRHLWLDASAGAESEMLRVAVSAWQPILTLGGRLTLGAGPRISAYAGAPLGYENRGMVQGNFPASLTIDPAVYSLNGTVFAEVRLLARVFVGANLDVVGVAVGPTRTVGSLVAKPQTASYFQYGSADHGALNSEFYVAGWPTSRLGFRIGLSHYVTDYTVTDPDPASIPSHRYQKFQTVPFLAVAVHP